MAYIDSNDPASAINSIEPERDAFIGGYVTRELKRALIDEAKTQRRTVSQQIMIILIDRYQKGNDNNGSTQQT